MPANVLGELPSSLSVVERAAVWMQYGTAYGALVELGKIGSGDFVIITAASSSVGLTAIQITRAQGATAIVTTRTSAKREQLIQLGAHHVIARQEEDLPAKVAAITGGKEFKWSSIRSVVAMSAHSLRQQRRKEPSTFMEVFQGKKPHIQELDLLRASISWACRS